MISLARKQLDRPIVTAERPTDSAGSADIDHLLTEARGGNPQSLGTLLQLYRNYLSVLASTQISDRLRRRVSPSDVVQETMLKAYRGFAGFRGSSELELLAWLRTILANNLATFVEQHLLAGKRDLRREVAVEQVGNSLHHSTMRLQDLVPASTRTPSASMQRREDAVLLADRIASLPADYAEVITLRNLQSVPFREIAQRMNRSESATRMLWLRAIDKLRSTYRDEGDRE